MGSTEVVPKYDPRIARRGKLDSLLAEAWLIWKQACEFTPQNFERTNILLEIVQTLRECIRTESVAADPDCDHPVFIDTTAWYGYMQRKCTELAQRHFGDIPDSVIGAKINLLRAHIRETELMFCYENATYIDSGIQWRLNALATAAYVAMWAEDEGSLQTD